MKKLLPLFILIFAIATTAIGQTTTENGTQVIYDKFKDTTRVQLVDFSGSVSMIASFSYDGSKLTKNAEHFYIFFSGSRCSGFCFQDAALILLIDGERFHAGVRRGLGDSTIYAMDRDAITKIANAKLVEYQVGRFEGKWEGKMLAKFKTLLDLGTVKK